MIFNWVLQAFKQILGEAISIPIVVCCWALEKWMIQILPDLQFLIVNTLNSCMVYLKKIVLLKKNPKKLAFFWLLCVNHSEGKSIFFFVFYHFPAFLLETVFVFWVSWWNQIRCSGFLSYISYIPNPIVQSWKWHCQFLD